MSESGTVVTEQVNVIYDDGTDEIEGLDPQVRQIASQLQQWVLSSRNQGNGTLIEPRKWEISDNPYHHIDRAQHLLRSNDLVTCFAELTEGLAFEGVEWESADSDVADVFNQMAAEQNLDEVIRKMWREEFAVSQVTIGLWWDIGTFKLRGTTSSGNAKKSKMDVWYPRRVHVFDPMKIVPVGMLAFGQERMAYRALPDEMAAFTAMQSGAIQDDLMARFFVAKYEPVGFEALELAQIGVDIGNLILLDERYVRRHTITRSDYERFAPVRMRSIFPLLDLRQTLMEADRVALVGAANYILLVKKGDKDNPGKPEEIRNLKEGFRTLARVPVIFSDHRLSIEIITPKQDFTLQRDKYDMLDTRIAHRLVHNFGAAGTSRSTGGDHSPTVGKATAKVLQGRRHMLRRFLEVILSRAVIEHPLNASKLGSKDAPSLAYVPANISVVDDAAIAQQILSLRTQKELSRETTLEFFGYDQEVEAMRREIEADQFDDIFQTQVPFSTPNSGVDPNADPNAKPQVPADQAGKGAQGGRPAGGGKPSQNPTKTARTARGTTPKGN